jgi:hypothetical protein
MRFANKQVERFVTNPQTEQNSSDLLIQAPPPTDATALNDPDCADLLLPSVQAVAAGSAGGRGLLVCRHPPAYLSACHCSLHNKLNKFTND